MPDPIALLPGLLIALLAVVMVWFTIGTQRNISRGNLLLRLSLVRAPTVSVDLVATEAWTAGHTRRDTPEPEERETWTDDAGRGVDVRHDGRADLELLRGHWADLGQRSGGTWRISVRPTVPHLEIHLLAPDPPSCNRHAARGLADRRRGCRLWLGRRGPVSGPCLPRIPGDEQRRHHQEQGDQDHRPCADDADRGHTLARHDRDVQ